MATSHTPHLLSGEKTITATGTAERLVAASQLAYALTIIPKSGNAGQVYVGGSDVATTTNDGLDPAQALPISSDRPFDLYEIYLDVDTNGEGVDFYALKA